MMATTTTTPQTSKPAVQNGHGGAVQTYEEAWGTEGIDSTDIIIPRISMAQNMSEVVSDRKAQIGDIYLSTTKEVIAKAGTPVEFIPLMHYKTWSLTEKVNGKSELRGQEPFTPQNMMAPYKWTDEKTGNEWERSKCLNFFVLLVPQIKKSKDEAFPCILSFRKSSYHGGKVLVSHFAQARKAKKPAASATFKLSSKTEKGDLGTYQVFVVEHTDKPTPKDILDSVCKDWYHTIASQRNQVKVDEPAVGEVSDVEVPF